MTDCPLCRSSLEPGWLCADHDGLPWGHGRCDAPGVPCACNPDAVSPPAAADAIAFPAEQGTVPPFRNARAKQTAERVRICLDHLAELDRVMLEGRQRLAFAQRRLSCAAERGRATQDMQRGVRLMHDLLINYEGILGTLLESIESMEDERKA